jgi:putative flippase GtrA
VQFTRYIVVGAGNTVASYALYLLLLLVVDYRVAYSIAYVAGLISGYLAHTRWVFRTSPGAVSLLVYLTTYATMYLVSLVVLYGVVEWWSLPKPAAMLAALMVTIPASFLLLRRGFRTPT